MAEQARENITLREKFFYAYRSYKRAKMDETSSRIYARNQGREEGIGIGIEKGKMEGKLEGKMEGKLEGKMEVARLLKSQDIDVEVIAKATLLSVEEIEKI